MQIVEIHEGPEITSSGRIGRVRVESWWWILDVHSSPIAPSVWLRIGSAIFGRYRLKALYNTSHVGTFFFFSFALNDAPLLPFRYKERKKIRRRYVGITIDVTNSGISPNFEFTKRSAAKANEEKIEKRERSTEEVEKNVFKHLLLALACNGPRGSGIGGW